MARKLTVGKYPSGHALKGRPVHSGGASFLGAKGSAPSGGGGRPAGKAKPTTAGSGHKMGRGPHGQRAASAR